MKRQTSRNLCRKVPCCQKVTARPLSRLCSSLLWGLCPRRTQSCVVQHGAASLRVWPLLSLPRVNGALQSASSCTSSLSPWVTRTPTFPGKATAAWQAFLCPFSEGWCDLSADTPSRSVPTAPEGCSSRCGGRWAPCQVLGPLPSPFSASGPQTASLRQWPCCLPITSSSALCVGSCRQTT